MPGVLKYWDGSAWVEVDVPGPVGPTGPTGPTGPEGALGIPTGMIFPYAAHQSLSVPSGWLACDGTTVTSSSYPALFNALTNNGAAFPYGGSGTTTYTPNLTNKFIRGSLTPGTTGGSDTNIHAHGYRMDALYKTSDGQAGIVGGYHFGTTYGSASSQATIIHGFATTNTVTLRQDLTFNETINTIPAYTTMRYIIKT